MELVTVTDEGPIRIVALNNPSKGNAISKPMAEQLQVVMKEFERRDDLRCAIITATGTRAFTFGADVSDPPELWRAIPTVGFKPLKPVICAVEGWCVGGGIVLAMMCDLMVCGSTAKFYYPEAKLGLTGGMIAGLVSRIPHKIAMEIALLCRTIDAQRAERVGLVNEVVPEGEALAKAKEWALELCGMAPMVLWEIKRMVTEDIIPRGPSEQMAIHGQRMAAIRNSADFVEGVAAFREKRPPKFEGR